MALKWFVKYTFEKETFTCLHKSSLGSRTDQVGQSTLRIKSVRRVGTVGLSSFTAFKTKWQKRRVEIGYINKHELKLMLKCVTHF